MPTVNTPTMNPGQHVLITVDDYQNDGVTLDTVEQVTFSKIGGAADILVEEVIGNNRKFKLTANSVGQAHIVFTANDVSIENALTVVCTVEPPTPVATPTSHVELALDGVEGPFGP